MKIYTPKVHSDIRSGFDVTELCLAFLPLYPSDCLSLAYYARLKLKSLKKESKLDIILTLCSITDVGLEAFTNEMSKEVTPAHFALNLICNPIITDRAHRSITTLLSRCKMSSLGLLFCMLPDTVSTTLKCVISGLNNSPLKHLSLGFSHISDTHVHYLILLVRMNSNLRSLDLSHNDLNKAIPLLSSALIHSKIECMSFERCNIDDDGLYCLFEVLCLREIYIDNNPKITTLGLKKYLSMLLEEEYSHPTLLYLYLSTESLLNEENERIIENINSIRRDRYRGVPPLYVADGNKQTGHEKKITDWGGNNKELVIRESQQQYIAERYSSRSAHY